MYAKTSIDIITETSNDDESDTVVVVIDGETLFDNGVVMVGYDEDTVDDDMYVLLLVLVGVDSDNGDNDGDEEDDDSADSDNDCADDVDATSAGVVVIDTPLHLLMLSQSHGNLQSVKQFSSTLVFE